MRTIIAGSRDISTYELVSQAVDESYFHISEIISGGARGVDSLAIEYAKKNNIPYKIMNANWDKYGKSAGYKSNVEMALVADALIAIWDKKSSGTKHMIDIMDKMKKPYYILEV